MGELKDITLVVLISIRDEIRKLREDTNLRFEQMDKRFEQMDKRFELMNDRLFHIETDISQMKSDIKAIATHFERNYLLLANEVGVIKGRLTVCEEKLGI